MPLLDAEVSVTKKVLDINFFALVTLTRAFALLLIASKGTVVNIGSVLGYTPIPWSGYYNASKAAVNLLTDQMCLEFSPWDIKCILVVAGAIRTKFHENLPEAPHLPEGSLYSPAKVEVEHGMSGADLEKNAMDVDAAATQIIANALKWSRKKHQWIGGGASTIWSANAFGWSTISVSLVSTTMVSASNNAGFHTTWACQPSRHHKEDPGKHGHLNTS